MHHPDAPEKTKHTAGRVLNAVSGLVSVAVVAGLATITTTGLHLGETVASGFSPPSLARCSGETPGFLKGRFYGDLEQGIDWTGDALRCGGMFRPDGQGMRMLFAPATDGLLVVLGIDGGPETVLDREVPVNLTVIDEATGRFFNSGDGERCWTRVSRVTVRGNSANRVYDIGGSLYCTGALAAVNGPGFVTPGDFDYAGRVSAETE